MSVKVDLNSHLRLNHIKLLRVCLNFYCLKINVL